MNLKDTKLFFLEKDCAEQFGASDGAELYRAMSQITKVKGQWKAKLPYAAYIR